MDISACVIDLQQLCLTAGQKEGQRWKIDSTDIEAILTKHLDPQPEPEAESPPVEEDDADDSE